MRKGFRVWGVSFNKDDRENMRLLVIRVLW